MDKKNLKKQGSKAEEDLFLKKHVGLIHCENKLTLMQRKICNILLFNALDKIHEKDIHEIPLRQLCSLIGYNSNDSKLIKDAIKSLISIVMEWNLLEDSKFLNEDSYPEDMITWNASALLAGASIRKGIIQYSYSPQMKSVLSSLDIYGRINLFVQAKFNSTYSLVLYENCARFKNLKQTALFPLDLFRSLMGVPEGKYASFKEFKRNVINVAVNEINKKSDIYIEPDLRKVGRTVVGIQFLLHENENFRPTFKKPKREVINSPQQQSLLLEMLTHDFQLSEQQAQDIISNNRSEYLIEKMNLVKTKKKVENPGAYLFSAIKNDYKNKQPPLMKQNPIENTYLRESKKASEIQSLRKKYMLYKLKAYTDFLNQQNPDIQETIKKVFEDSLKPQREVYRLYLKSGLNSPFVTTSFLEFIDDNYPGLVNQYLSFDDYITSEEFD